MHEPSPHNKRSQERARDASSENLQYDSPPILDGEMLARGTIFVGFRAAVLDLWGARGMEHLASRLPPDVRRDTVSNLVVSTQWLPETHVLAWYEALWTGPCEEIRESFARVLDRMLDCGFGRIRKAFLAFAKPAMIFEKAPTLWRYDHTHGLLTVMLGGRSARLRLEQHPYVDNPLSCMAAAEIYRYCVTLCRARNVTETHYRDADGALIVRLRWDP